MSQVRSLSRPPLNQLQGRFLPPIPRCLNSVPTGPRSRPPRRPFFGAWPARLHRFAKATGREVRYLRLIYSFARSYSERSGKIPGDFSTALDLGFSVWPAAWAPCQGGQDSKERKRAKKSPNSNSGICSLRIRRFGHAVVGLNLFRGCNHRRASRLWRDRGGGGGNREAVVRFILGPLCDHADSGPRAGTFSASSGIEISWLLPLSGCLPEPRRMLLGGRFIPAAPRPLARPAGCRPANRAGWPPPSGRRG